MLPRSIVEWHSIRFDIPPDAGGHGVAGTAVEAVLLSEQGDGRVDIGIVLLVFLYRIRQTAGVVIQVDVVRPEVVWRRQEFRISGSAVLSPRFVSETLRFREGSWLSISA